MNQEEKRQFEKMKEELALLKSFMPAHDKNILFDGYKNIDDTDLERTISITIGGMGGTDTAEVLDYPDDMILMRYNGKIGRIAWWDETRFN